jgi:hypothetical protein
LTHCKIIGEPTITVALCFAVWRAVIAAR